MKQSVSGRSRNQVGQKTINNCATKMFRIGAVIILVVYILGTSSWVGCLAAEIPLSQYGNDSLGAENQAMPPLDLLMQMSCAGDVEEFLNFIDTSSVDGKDNFVSRSSGLERSLAITPKPATCKTEPVVVPLQPEGASSMALYYPSCTRVNRCGGCCSHALLSCQPTATETLTFQVIKAEWNGAKYVYANKELVVVEQHVNCTCGCAVREEHCNGQQKYYPGQCKCVCQNVEERDKCLKESELKLWDEDLCRCTCRKPSDCTTGTYFNENQCQCLKIPYYSSSSSNGEAINQQPSVSSSQQPGNVNLEDRKKYYLKPIPLPSSDTTKYSTTTN